ncbi:MAG TPA: SMI1/KNR4 family protein [Bryobacteraceae bacterium]|nr:SMI1/KNR4 family protein [Bryobacteraceae bacterium]
MATESRTFEFHEGSSDKFWTITLSGSSHTVHFGRKGTNGQEQTKDLGNEALARSSYEKLISEKLKKGYQEVGAEPSSVPHSVAPPAAATPNQLSGVWAKIDKWLKQNAPVAMGTLEPPATPQQLSQLETALGMPVPPDLLCSLQIHNGQKNTPRWTGLMEGWRLLGCGEIAEWSKTMARLLVEGDFDDAEAEGDGQVKAEWWNIRWVPFLESGSGDLLCIDMDPDEDGRSGQVIEFRHDEGDREVRERSFNSYLTQFASDLFDDVYHVTDRGGLSDR